MGYITEGMNIHGIPVDEENYRVQIEKVLIPNVSLHIPINKEIYFIGHVVGSFVAWPMCLVVKDGDQQQRKHAPKKEKKKALLSIPHNQKH